MDLLSGVNDGDRSTVRAGDFCSNVFPIFFGRVGLEKQRGEPVTKLANVFDLDRIAVRVLFPDAALDPYRSPLPAFLLKILNAVLDSFVPLGAEFRRGFPRFVGRRTVDPNLVAGVGDIGHLAK